MEKEKCMANKRILGILAAKMAEDVKVVAVDINPYAIRCARRNAELNGTLSKMDFILLDLFNSIRPRESFDLIIFNAITCLQEPDEGRTLVELSWIGGLSGREIIDRFIDEASNYLKEGGKILLVRSSLSDVDKTLRAFESKGLRAEVIAERKFKFEGQKKLMMILKTKSLSNLNQKFMRVLS